MSLFEHSWSSKGSKISQNVSKIDLFEHFWSPWAPQNSSFSVCFQVGKPIFLRVGCDFYSKSHEISRKTRGFSLFETGETLYFTCPNAVFLVFFSADSSKNTFFTQKVALKLEFLSKVLKITIKSVLFGVIGRVIPRNLRVFTFEKREILRFGCIFEGLLLAKPCF